MSSTATTLKPQVKSNKCLGAFVKKNKQNRYHGSDKKKKIDPGTASSSTEPNRKPSPSDRGTRNEEQRGSIKKKDVVHNVNKKLSVESDAPRTQCSKNKDEKILDPKQNNSSEKIAGEGSNYCSIEKMKHETNKKSENQGMNEIQNEKEKTDEAVSKMNDCMNGNIGENEKLKDEFVPSMDDDVIIIGSDDKKQQTNTEELKMNCSSEQKENHKEFKGSEVDAEEIEMHPFLKNENTNVLSPEITFTDLIGLTNTTKPQDPVNTEENNISLKGSIIQQNYGIPMLCVEDDYNDEEPTKKQNEETYLYPSRSPPSLSVGGTSVETGLFSQEAYDTVIDDNDPQTLLKEKRLDVSTDFPPERFGKIWKMFHTCCEPKSDIHAEIIVS